MGCDTRGLLKGHIREEEVLNFIKQKFDKNATMDISDNNMGNITANNYNFIKKNYDNTNKWIIRSGFINFKYKDRNRNIFYFYDNCNTYDDLDYYSEYGLEDMVKSETTSVSLGCWGDSEEIIKPLVEHFGGWYDYNDCDDIEYEPIFKNNNDTIEPVIHVTMEDIYNKFGGVVIIDK